MKRINLIPQEARRSFSEGWIKRCLFKSRTSRLVAFSISILFFIFVYQSTSSLRYGIRISLQKKSLKKVEAELTQSKYEQSQVRKRMEAVEQENKYLQKKLSFLEQAKLDAVEWSDVVLYLSKLAPSDLWLSKIYLNTQMITINGTTLDNSRVSDFMVKLEESGYFKDTSFNFTQKKRDIAQKLKEFPVIDFEITTQLAR